MLFEIRGQNEKYFTISNNVNILGNTRKIPGQTSVLKFNMKIFLR